MLRPRARALLGLWLLMLLCFVFALTCFATLLPPSFWNAILN